MKKTTYLFFCCILIITIITIVCTLNTPKAFVDANAAYPRKLALHTTLSQTSKTVKYDAEQLNSNYSGSLQYLGFSEVSIEIGGEIIPLNSAIKNAVVSVGDLISWARNDAQNNHCVQRYSSEHGLTVFTYSYPEYTIEYIDDVYETPNGKQHYMQYFRIYTPGGNLTTSHSYYEDNSEYPYKIDREDWGITLNTIEVTPNSISIQCHQANGQQIGDLEIKVYEITSKEGPLFGENLETSCSSIEIPKNTVSEFSIDWTQAYGSLSSGQYLLHLYITDIYEPESVHPLMQNFYDMQRYFVEFSVP